MNQYKKLFDIVNEVGETLDGELHIIDTSDEYPVFEGDKKYRVYHKDGYCFDTEKVGYENEKTGELSGFEYEFYSEWDDFKKIHLVDAIKLIKSCTK